MVGLFHQRKRVKRCVSVTNCACPGHSNYKANFSYSKMLFANNILIVKFKSNSDFQKFNNNTIIMMAKCARLISPLNS